MGVQLGSAYGQIDIGTDGAKKSIDGLLSSMDAFAGGLKKAGIGMTAGVTAPLVGMAAATIHSANQFNGLLANVQSLGVGSERIEELRGSVQAMSVDVGKSTSDLTEGLYQVISAFGDSADTASILEINARAAAAGLATTEEAIALTSAVTKGYGDTSATAVQQVSDLAFTAVQLGQTTFPELAASMGRVTPLASSLGVSMEEMFGVMATATGVTGTASEVSTQLRAVLQSLMAPTQGMSELLDSMGYASGEAMLQTLGLQGTIEAIVGAAEASGAPLQGYIGSVEGQTLALSLAGEQAGVFTEKLAAMEQASGASADAFTAQTEGVNSTAFEMQQLQMQLQVTAQQLGEALIPALSQALTAMQPLIDFIVQLVQRFTEMDQSTQMVVIAVGAFAAAIGPVLMVLGSVVSVVSTLGPLFGVLGSAIGLVLSPVGLLVAGVGALLAIMFDWGGANELVASTLESWGLTAVADGVRALHEGVSGLVAAVGDFFSGETSFSEFFEAAIPDWLVTLFNWTWPILGPIAWIVKLTAWAWPSLSKPDWIQKLLDFRWPGFPTRPGWLGGGGDADQNAMGTNFFRGGATWVGEQGPELIELPRGTKIFDNNESMRMAGAAAGGMGGVHFHGPVYMQSEADVDALARRVVQRLRWNQL